MSLSANIPTKVKLEPIINEDTFYNYYDIFDTKSKGEEYDYEELFMEMMNKFIQKYDEIQKIDEYNFVNFKKDAYWLFSYFYKMNFVEEDIDDNDSLNEEEMEKYNCIKENTKIILDNIKTLRYKKNYENDSVMNSIKIVINFIDETRENLEEMNTIMRSTTTLLEDFTKDLEQNSKLKEITEYIKMNSFQLIEINNYIIYLDNYLKDYKNNDITKVMSDISLNIDYREKAQEGNSEEKKMYIKYMMIENIITLKTILKSKEKSLQIRLK